MTQTETPYKYEYPIQDMKSLKYAINSSFDAFLKNLPIQPQNNLPFQDKLKNCKESIIGILKGQGDSLWGKLEKEVTKQLDEYKRSNVDLKGKQSRLGTMLVKTENDENGNFAQKDQDASVLNFKIEGKEQTIENLKSEISQLEEENQQLQATPIPVIKPPPTAERNARSSYKSKQQEIQQLNTDYDQMRRAYSIKIQQASQSLESSQNEVDKLEIQLNSILGRINLMIRAGSLPAKRFLPDSNQNQKVANGTKNNLPPIHPNYNNQGLPQLNHPKSELPLTKIDNKPINQQFSNEISQKLTNEINSINQKITNEQKQVRQIVSEPRNDLKQRAFNRLGYVKPNNNENEDSSNNNEHILPGPITPRSVTGKNPTRRLTTPEMNKTDELLTNTKAVFEEADSFLKEIGDMPSDHENENEKIPKEPVAPHKSNTSPKKPKKKDNEISFMPISEEEVKKVARPLTCNESQTPGKRIQADKKAGYEFAFFFIAERVPKVQ